MGFEFGRCLLLGHAIRFYYLGDGAGRSGNNWAIALELSLGYLAGEANEPVAGSGLLI